MQVCRYAGMQVCRYAGASWRTCHHYINVENKQVSRRKRNKVEAEDKAEIDLTPMLDVVFIMLIFFIVTASFLKEKAIGINVPPDNDQPPPLDTESKNILISVNSNDDIYVDRRRVDIRAVRAIIAQKSAENPQGGVVVRAHEQSTAQTYVAIADAAREAKIFNVSLVPYKD
jgi:biopolymer transport protein ExbD